FSPLAKIEVGESTLVYSPMIKVHVTKDEPSKLSEIPPLDVIALIDTGSDYCRIDNMIASSLNLQVLTSGTSRHDNDHITSDIYGAWVTFEDRTTLPLASQGFHFRSTGTLFDMIIGMDA